MAPSDPNVRVTIQAGNAMERGYAAVLRDRHPDPFVQAAILRVYKSAPGLLDETLVTELDATYDDVTL